MKDNLEIAEGEVKMLKKHLELASLPVNCGLRNQEDLIKVTHLLYELFYNENHIEKSKTTKNLTVSW